MTQRSRSRARVSPPADFEEQLRQARGGCSEAIGELLQGCRRYLLLAASRDLASSLRPKEGASDLVQRTFVVAHRDFQAFRGTTLAELLAWLNRILERQLSTQIRHYKVASKRNINREVAFDGRDDGNCQGLSCEQPRPDAFAAFQDEQRRVHQAIEQLPEEYRQVLQLRTWQRLSFLEIGQRMGRTPAAVQKLWARAVERLQSVIKAPKS